MELSLESNKHKKSLNTDLYQPLNMERSSMVLPVSEINDIINTYKVFEEEREKCTKYRLNITLNPFMTNVLSNKITSIKNGVNELTEQDRVDKIQTIDDINNTYECGYDIFDNNYFRIPTFKTGETLFDFETKNDISKLLTIQKSITENLVDNNGWFGFKNLTKINSNTLFKTKQPLEMIDLFPGREYFLFDNFHADDDIYQNWDFILTYPYQNISNNKLVTSQSGINGIPISDSEIKTYDGKKYMIITTVYRHGLSQGDIIKIKRDDDNSDNTYLIYDTGDLDKLDLDYKFILDVNKYDDLYNIAGMTLNRICKVINKVDCDYYIRLFRKIPNFKNEIENITEKNISEKIMTSETYFDYESYQPGFSKNIFNDPIHQLQYTDDVDINLIKDNLGRPLTKLYMTVIKKGIESGNNRPYNVFTEIMSGVNCPPGVSGYTNIRLINGYNMSELPLESHITTTGGTSENCFFGDIVEYNKSTVKEIKITNIYHRFNTIQRETNNLSFIYHDIDNSGSFFQTGKTLSALTEGYFYNPHYEIELKKYSDIINEGELKILTNCFDFKSGLTFNNEVVLLSGQSDNNIRNLILRLNTLKDFYDYDNIRITRKSDKEFINTPITISINSDNYIFIPYDKDFMPNVSTLSIEDYELTKYSNKNIPLHSQDQYNGTCLWRDIINDIQTDKEITFTNGRLYINKLFNIYLRRQDPFGHYGLRKNSFPSDLFGENIEETIIDKKYNNINNVC